MNNTDTEEIVNKYNDPAYAYVRAYVKGLMDIFLVAKESYHIAYKLYNPIEEIEKDYMRYSPAIFFIRQTMWRACVMEVAKLCKDKEAYSLSKVIRKMKDGDFRNLNLSTIKIAKWENTLAVNTQLIKNIVLLRDKAIAHTDINKSEIQNISIAFCEVEIFLNIANEMIKEIFFEVFESDIQLEHVFERKFTILEELAENRQRKLQPLIDSFNKIKQ